MLSKRLLGVLQLILRKLLGKWLFKPMAVGMGGGAIIGSDLVITAAHVVNKFTSSQIKVGAGITQLTNATSSNLYGVKQIIYLPQYDIALLKLSRALSYNNSVRPIDFIYTIPYSIGTTVRITGYGKTKRPIDDPFQTE